MNVLPILAPPPLNVSGVYITVPDSPTMYLSEQCLQTLVYPSQMCVVHDPHIRHPVSRIRLVSRTLSGKISLGSAFNFGCSRSHSLRSSTIQYLTCKNMHFLITPILNSMHIRYELCSLAVLMTRTISTAWAVYAIWRGPTFNSNFEEIIASPGSPCSLEVFGSFFSTREGFEVSFLFYIYSSALTVNFFSIRLQI